MSDEASGEPRASLAGRVKGFTSGYGMLGVLILLCLFFSWATVHTEQPTGSEGAQSLAADIVGSTQSGARIVIVTQSDATEKEFADVLKARLAASGFTHVAAVDGDPPTVRGFLETRIRAGEVPDVVATTPVCRQWTVFDGLRQSLPAFAKTVIRAPVSRRRSTFLSPGNLRNVADQTAVIAIIAVGMTLVILTGGIDLSVGSLVALSAVVTAWLVQKWGGVGASTGAMVGACLIAILACGAVGVFSGVMITGFRIPPFIATLAMMQVGSGLAFIVAQGQSIHDMPPGFTWLGRGTTVASLPNAVVLMVAIYVLAHIVMMRARVGRRIYAVGGNPEAARLSGLRTNRTILGVYVVSGLSAGVGGVITASQLNAGSPTYGQMLELYVIAAVVVGGTSLTGGEGRVPNTLIGAFIIAVIRNGMNLTNIEPYTQKVVLGLVILGAVLMDRIKRRKR